MKQKMLKLIKILNRFTIDDILSMSDFKESETTKLLSEFEKLNIVRKISQDEYFYIPEISKTQAYIKNQKVLISCIFTPKFIFIRFISR